MIGRRLLNGLISASVLLFWLQALRAAFSTLFGIIYDQIFVGPATAWLGISNLLLFLAFLVPLALGGRGPAWIHRLAPAAAAAGRAFLSQPEASVRYWASLGSLAAGSYFLASLLRRERGSAFQALGVALCLDQLLRSLGHTFDLSFQPEWQALPLAWSGLLLVAVLWGWVVSQREAWQGAQPHAAGRGSAARPRPAAGWLAGLGLGGWLFLETSLLAVPSAAASWSGGHYAALAPGLLIATCVTLGWAPGLGDSSLARISRWAAIYLPLGLLLGYFTSGPWAAAALLLSQMAAMLALGSLPGVLFEAKARWLVAGGLLVLLANYLNAFTFTYPYTLPFTRGLGWVVYLLSAAPVTSCLLLGSAEWRAGAMPKGWKAPAWVAAGLAVLLSTWSVRPVPAGPLPGRDLVLASYNIHYGYDSRWHFTLEEQAQALAANAVDVVALQEVDAGRMTSYMVDDAYYLARRLDMNAAYLPTVEHLTGIALLYKGEAAPIRQRLLTSLQEQTGIVGVELPMGGAGLWAFGVWLGLENEDTLNQIQEALGFIGPTSPAVLAGDFNALDDSPVIEAVRQAGFVDPFASLGLLPPPTAPAERPSQRIDYLWLRSLAATRAGVADTLASDHRLVVVQVQALP